VSTAKHSRARIAAAKRTRREAASDVAPALGGSLADEAYERLKLGIISLRYRPGAYINEAQISADLGLGRTPVHHAVTRLSLERMVEIIPRKGVIVSPISLQDVMASVEVRLMLEPNCARLAAERGTDQDVRELSAILARAGRLAASRDVMGLMDIDRQFHSRLAKAARNEMLEDILKRLHQSSLRFWFISLSDPKHMSGVDREHLAVLEALRSHDPRAAEHAMRAHIESFRDHIRASV
jgi:GntR family transcriptional regulator, rspAB operon transcriptional repressor